MDNLTLSSDKKENKKSPFAEQYPTIGNYLSILESSTFRVGIPLLLPTSRILKQRRHIQDSVDEYFKVNLVDIKTEVLESYLDDLRTLPFNLEENSYLGLETPSEHERYGLILYLIACLGIFSFSLLGLPKNSIGWGAFLVFICFSLVLWILNLVFGSEHYRRNTFIWYINKELLRRRGITPGRTMNAVKAE